MTKLEREQMIVVSQHQAVFVHASLATHEYNGEGSTLWIGRDAVGELKHGTV